MAHLTRGAWVVLAVLVAGCGTGTSVSASPTSQVAHPSATAHCRLPVAQLPEDPNAPARRPVGFVTYPDGTLSVDTDAITYDSGTDRYRTVKQPTLYGQSAAAYDGAVGRWLPTEPGLVSPDGRQYAYTVSDITENGAGAESEPYPVVVGGHVHVVDVASGKDRVLLQGEYQAVAYTAEGIYVVDYNYQAARASYDLADGLWLLDVVTGRLRQITGNRDWRIYGGGAFWSDDVDPADPHPWMYNAVFTRNNRVSRLDPRTGEVQRWFLKLGQAVEVIGFDGQGHPLVRVGRGGPPESWELWLVTGPDAGHLLYGGPLARPEEGVKQAIGDSHGIWFSGGPGILLYKSGQTLSKVTAVIANPVGPCE